MPAQKIFFTLLFIFWLAFISCLRIKKSVKESYRNELYIDYKYVSFQGKNSRQALYFAIDSIRESWFHGKLMVNTKDTYSLRGFKKGDLYYTTYYQNPYEKRSGSFYISCRGQTGQIRDSICIIDNRDTNRLIYERTTLFRRSRAAYPQL